MPRRRGQGCTRLHPPPPHLSALLLQMPILHIAAVDRSCRSLLSHFCAPATVAEQVDWEARLAAEVRPLLDASFRQDVPLALGPSGEERFVLLRGVSGAEVAFVVTGCAWDDELALVGAMDALVAIITAVCDGRLNPAHLVDFHGKVVVALDEAVWEGVLVHSDPETVLRNAKLKPYKV
jgi:hypothetical protein